MFTDYLIKKMVLFPEKRSKWRKIEYNRLRPEMRRLVKICDQDRFSDFLNWDRNDGIGINLKFWENLEKFGIWIDF